MSRKIISVRLIGMRKAHSLAGRRLQGESVTRLGLRLQKSLNLLIGEHAGEPLKTTSLR